MQLDAFTFDCSDIYHLQVSFTIHPLKSSSIRAMWICSVHWLVTHKKKSFSLRWRHNGRDGVSNHQPHDCLLNRLFRRRSKTTSKLRVTGLCAGNSPGTGEFPAQMASYAENVSVWWRHHVIFWKSHEQLLINWDYPWALKSVRQMDTDINLFSAYNVNDTT